MDTALTPDLLLDFLYVMYRFSKELKSDLTADSSETSSSRDRETRWSQASVPILDYMSRAVERGVHITEAEEIMKLLQDFSTLEHQIFLYTRRPFLVQSLGRFWGMTTMRSIWFKIVFLEVRIFVLEHELEEVLAP